MDHWSVPHRTTAVRFYYETKSVTEVQRLFRRHFNVGRYGRVPSRNTVLAWVSKFEELGSVLDVKHGAPRTVRTPENLERVREAFQRSPRRSARQQSRILGVNRKSLGVMLKAIRFHPYKIQIAQKLSNSDKEARVDFCTAMLGLLREKV